LEGLLHLARASLFLQHVGEGLDGPPVLLHVRGGLPRDAVRHVVRTHERGLALEPAEDGHLQQGQET
jgi:hypothetical protein